jgi:hypothetical protein
MRCRALHRLADAAYLSGFLCSDLPSVAPYCAPGSVRVVSTFLQSKETPRRDFLKEVQTSFVVMGDSLELDCGP